MMKDVQEMELEMPKGISYKLKDLLEKVNFFLVAFKEGA